MLAFLRGTVQMLETGSILLTTSGGIWYEIHINDQVFGAFFGNGTPSGEQELFLYHQISENGQSLFGFLSLEERVFFKELIKIPGIGGKAAQAILWLGIATIYQAITEKEQEIFESVKGIGKKVAGKIINELQDNKTIASYELSHISSVKKVAVWDEYSQIVASLVAMGYQEKRVLEMLGELPEWLETTQDILAYLVRNI